MEMFFVKNEIWAPIFQNLKFHRQFWLVTYPSPFGKKTWPSLGCFHPKAKSKIGHGHAQ